MQRRHFTLSALGLLAAGAVRSQSWPARPIRMIVPYPPGGPTDITARVYAQHLQGVLGQSVVIDNRAGAGGEVGAEMAAKAAGDGYTLLFGGVGALTIHAVLLPQKSNYDLKTDLLPVSMGSNVPLALAVRSSMPVKNFREFVEFAKSQPKPLTFGSAGNGTSQHMAGEYFAQAAKVPMVHVPYRGSGPAMADLLGGQIDCMVETLPPLAPHFTSPKLRILAVASATRSELLPDTPTLSEAGLADFEVSTWYGLLAPKGTPKAIIDQLSAAMQTVARKPEVVASLKNAGADAIATTPDRMNSLMQAEIEKWGRVQKTAQIKM